MTTHMHTHPDEPASAVAEWFPVAETGTVVEVTVEAVINGHGVVLTLSQIVPDPGLRALAAATMLREASQLVERAVSVAR